MNNFGKIVDLLTGGFGAKLVDTVSKYLPASMSEKEKKEFELRLLDAARTQEIELLRLTQTAEAEFNNRIKDHEGTASDLARIPYLGSLILFLRGTQRPLFGFLTLYVDYQVFSGAWTIPEGTVIENAFFAVNLLVLGFLFGERTVKNILPLLERYMKK